MVAATIETTNAERQDRHEPRRRYHPREDGKTGGRYFMDADADLPAIVGRVRSSFAKQGLMTTLGASLVKVARGSVEIELRPSPSISQQHGFVHAGAVAAIADSAAGYAALTLMPPGSGVLSTEFKINLLAPARGDRIVARGGIVKAGRTLTVAQSEVVAETDGEEKLIALVTATLMRVEARDGIAD